MSVKHLDAVDPKFRGQLASGKWTLCIGAGVSRGIVPTWEELTRRLVNDTFNFTYNETEFRQLVAESAWSLDSWIQACSNHFLLDGRAETDFFDQIEKHLYSDLLAKALKSGLQDALIRILDRPQNASKEEVFAVCEFFERQYDGSSLLAITRVLLEAASKNRLPDAVITFNADTLLQTLLNLFQSREHYLGAPPHSHPRFQFKTVLRPVDSAKVKTPIYHCHGAIKPKSERTEATGPRDSRDRLVFLESEYIRVATTSASWPETLFMFHAQTTALLMLGFSMSDPNMRRWLALTNDSVLRDFAAMTAAKEITPRHTWLTTRVTDAKLTLLRDEALIHLGVRPGWIPTWGHVEEAMANLLAL